MADIQFLQSTQVLECQNWLKEAPDEKIVGLLFRHGHTEFMSHLEDWQAQRVKGLDADGVPVTFHAPEVIGFYLLDRSSLPTGTVEQGQSADLEAWQTALMELRAAAEESKDERVSKAAARMARLEDGS